MNTKQLENLISYHNKKYFIDNEPEITDPEFDLLTEKLKKLKPNSKVLFEIVGEIGDVIHPTPMLSIEKRYTHEDIIKWIDETGEEEYYVEPKYDGMAARYQDGILSTRGNGHLGENITQKFEYLKIIGTLPIKTAPAFGEIIIPNDYFNDKLSKDYKNPRNAVVGIIKSKRPSDAGINALINRGIHFVLHDSAFKLKVCANDIKNPNSWEDLLEEIFRNQYPLDGIVIKVIDPKVRIRLGSTEHHEKWQVAYKVPAERQWTKVINIKDQVGRTGRITSVAIVKPIDLSGATITNITLHNAKFVEDSKIDIGSEVEVCRSGEVIPFITNIKNKHESKPKYKIPTVCPICSTKLIKTDHYLDCPNKECVARKALSMEYFFKALRVENLGIKTIERFINDLGVKDIFDFYKLQENNIAKLDGFGKTSARNIVDSIKKTLNSNITESQLLQAIGIREIGPATSKWIINKYGINNMNQLTETDLSGIKGMGTVKSKIFMNEIKNSTDLINSLLKVGLKFKNPNKSKKLSGMSFCITGKKVRYSRDELIELIEANGGEYKSSVTGNLTYLIAGDEAGSKINKATDIGVKVINESEFLEMITSS